MNLLKKISLVFTMGFNLVGFLIFVTFLVHSTNFGEGLLHLLVMAFFIVNMFAVVRWDDE